MVPFFHLAMNSSVVNPFDAVTPSGLFPALLLVIAVICAPARAEFLDTFDQSVVKDPTGINGWNFFVGDGTPTMDFTSANGIATIHVDATTDRRGIWWAIIKRQISSSIDLAKLAAPNTELRVEARIRSSHAPRRVNLSVNTQHTTDFHGDLMEFDVGKAHDWQTISFTTHSFDGRVGDQLNAQLALMDWGLGKYDVDVDYFKVELVDPATAGPDLGVPIPYRPEIASPTSFKQSIPAIAVATVDRREPNANFADWSAVESSGPIPIATVNGTQYVILRWDLSAFAGKKAVGSGLLELKTHSVQRPATRRKDFGMMRVVEILGGDPHWSASNVTYDSLLQGRAYEDVFNTQMIIDVDVTDERNGSTLITLSRPALQRLLDQRTKGIVLIPLGSINAAFFTGSDTAQASRLLFNLEP